MALNREWIQRWARHNPRVAIGVAAVLFGTLVTMIAVVGIWLIKAGDRPSVDVRPEPSITNVSRGRDWLTGQPTDEPAVRPFAVMVENHSEARPQSGLSQAALVYEVPVEGGITRFLAVFSGHSTVREIGPVRSVRPYYVDWAHELDADLVHVGGSPEAITRLQTLDINDADEFAWGRYFWRSSRRPAPHNTYTSAELLTELRDAREWSATSTVTSWRFAEAVPTEHPTSSPPIVIDFSSATYRVEWRYDGEQNVYRRFIAGAPDNDKDDTPIVAQNIIVLRTDAQVLDAEGRLRVRTTGSGRAWIFHNGLRTEVLWKKPTAKQRMHFETPDGKEIYFTPGTTWVEVTTRDMPVRHGVVL